MLLIRSSQMDTLDVYSMDQYKAELCRHLSQYDPLLCETAGPKALEEVVDLGLERAHKCDFTQDGPIRTYLEIMLSLGSDFDGDPQYFWLTTWLQPQDYYQEMDRARYLQFHVLRYLNDVQGSEKENRIEALRRLMEVTLDQLIEIGRDDNEKAIRWLESIHPLKCRFIGHNALELLIQMARQEATETGLKGPEGFLLLLGLMFIHGRGVLSDPMHPEVTKQSLAKMEKA